VHGGCTSCAKRCQAGAIAGEKKQLYMIDADKCIECGVCGRICPTGGAVLDQHSAECVRVKKADWPKPVVIRSICSSCGICVDICPFKCLAISDPVAFPQDFTANAFLKDPKACVGCSMCADIYPQEAIYLASSF